MGRLPVILMLAVIGWFFLWPEDDPMQDWEPVGWTYKVDEAHVKVFWQEDDEAVNTSFEEYWGLSLFGEKLSGWSALDDYLDPDSFAHDEYRCHFYLVEPKYVDDEYMLSLGHEAYHCFRGAFHKEVITEEGWVTEVDK